MFTCSHCTFRYPFEWSLKEHMYVKHNDSSNLNINSTILSPPTKIYAGQNGVNVPTTVSIPPIRKAGRQSGMGVEYEDTDSEHGDTDEETTVCLFGRVKNYLFITQTKISFYINQMVAECL